MSKNFFRVEAMVGELRNGKHIWAFLAIAANNREEAIKAALEFKKVMRDRNDAIGGVEEITFEEYSALKEANDMDPYLHGLR